MELRWGLLLVALVVTGLVYIYSRYRPRENRRSDSRGRRTEPVFAGVEKYRGEEVGSTGGDSEPLVTLLADFPDTRVDESPDVEPENDVAGDQAAKIIAIRLMARKGKFPADKLILALREAGLRHGQFGIFHRPGEDEGLPSEFSVANLIEPGSFDLTRIKTDYYPGVSIFMMLPGVGDGLEAFDDMLTTSRSLADKLDGELLDEQGSSLSIQRERFLREEVVQFQLDNH
jgi:cell division protein ZipA